MATNGVDRDRNGGRASANFVAAEDHQTVVFLFLCGSYRTFEPMDSEAMLYPNA
jgi:hypothetical protein